jgi:hypothetical protein
LCVNILSFSFSFYGFGALPLCGAGIWLDAAVFNDVMSCRSGDVQIAGSGSALIDVSIYIEKDSSIFKTQAKQHASEESVQHPESPHFLPAFPLNKKIYLISLVKLKSNCPKGSPYIGLYLCLFEIVVYLHYAKRLR